LTRNGLRLQSSRNVIDQHGEFISVQPRQGGATRDHAADPACDLRQQPVADPVSERMVDRAEMIQIEHHDRDGVAMALGVGDRFYEAFFESLPIRQAGERIMSGEILQARMYFFEFACIAAGPFAQHAARNGDHLSHCEHRAGQGSGGNHEQVLRGAGIRTASVE
jgi:hypothetical protein